MPRPTKRACMDQTPDTRSGYYYVSVMRDDGAHRLLLGPYRDDHKSALRDVDVARAMAERIDPRAIWYAYGTCRTDDDRGPGILNGVSFRFGGGAAAEVTMCGACFAAYVADPGDDVPLTLREGVCTSDPCDAGIAHAA